MKFHNINYTAFVILICINFSACKPTTTENSNAIRFGVMVPLSNDFAANGRYIKIGIEKAEQELRQAGEKIEIIFEDACLAIESRSSIQKLVNINKIDAIAGNYCVVALDGIKSFIIKNEIITMQTSVTPPSLLKENKFIFTNFPKVENEVSQLLNYITNKKENAKIGLFTLETPWGLAYSNLLKKEVIKTNSEIVINTLKSISETNFRTELTKIRTSNADFIIAIHVGNALSTILKQSKSLGLKQKFLSVQESFDDNMIKESQGAAENLSLFIPKSFTTSLKDKENPIHPLSAHAYDDTIKLFRKFKECNKNKKCVLNKMIIEKEKNTNSTQELFLTTVKNGKFTLFKN